MRRAFSLLAPALLAALLVGALAACEGDGGGAALDVTADAPAPPDDAPAGLPDAAAPADARPDAPPVAPDAARDAPPDTPPGPDARPDVAAPEDVAPPRDVLVAVPCDPAALVGTSVDLLPGVPAPLIHPALAFDGHALWLVWNQREPAGSGFDTWAARLACDGSVSVPPFRAHAADDGNDVNPTVAAGADGALVAWATDTGGAPNLFVRWRVFGLDGAPRGPEQTLVPRPGGEPAAASAWMVQAATVTTRAGGWLLAGSWASPAVERFQVFAQGVAADGAPSGPFLTAPAEADAGQLEPAVAVAPDGSAWLAWTREPDQGARRTDVARVAGDPPTIGAPEPATPASLTVSSLLPALAAAPTPDGPVWLAYTRQTVGVGGAERDVVVRRADAPPDGPELVAGAPRAEDFAPALAAAPDGDGGLLVWFRARSGYAGDVWAQRFRADADGPVADGEPQLLNPPDAEGDHDALVPYGAGVVALPDDVWVVVWVEGRNPDFRLRARFLSF